MQPKTTIKFDQNTFNRLKRSVNNISTANKKSKIDPGYAPEFPEEIGIQLLYGCNLRCTMCYQWSETGLFHNIKESEIKKEISPEIVLKVLEETKEVNSKLFLWGGEPFYHSQWNEIARILEKYNRWTTICTNGLLIEKNIDTLLPISENLVLLISLDGFREQNDELRGKGTFDKILNQIINIKELQKKGIYKGLISINTVINDHLLGHLYDFAVFLESLNVDSVYFNYPWYISEKKALLMDDFYKKRFGHLNINLTGKESWKSYTYAIAPQKIEILRNQIDKLAQRTWKMRLRFQPPLEENEVFKFIQGEEEPNIKNSKCFAVVNRMDIHADGSTGSCKFFPELAVGNIYKESLHGIWHSKNFSKLRQMVVEQLMPICSKCVLLYLNGQ